MIIIFDAYKPIIRPHENATFPWTVFRCAVKNAKSDYQLRHVCMFVCLLSVCPSVSPYGTTRFPLDGFSWNLLFENFGKSVEKISVPLKSNSIRGILHEDLCTIFIINRLILLRMRNVSHKLAQKLETHILCSINFCRKIVVFYMIYLSTAIGLTPDGSSTVHIYTHTQYIEQHK